jgi:hypothetical protein
MLDGVLKHRAGLTKTVAGIEQASAAKTTRALIAVRALYSQNTLKTWSQP